MKLIFIFAAILALTVAIPPYHQKNISVNDDGTVFITTTAGKVVTITRPQPGQHGVDVVITAPGVGTKHVHVGDVQYQDENQLQHGFQQPQQQWEQVGGDDLRLKRGSGKTRNQGDVISEIFGEYQGVVDDVQYEKLLHKVEKAVKKGQVSQQVYDLLQQLEQHHQQQQQQQQQQQGVLQQHQTGVYQPHQVVWPHQNTLWQQQQQQQHGGVWQTPVNVHQLLQTIYQQHKQQQGQQQYGTTGQNNIWDVIQRYYQGGKYGQQYPIVHHQYVDTNGQLHHVVDFNDHVGPHGVDAWQQQQQPQQQHHYVDYVDVTGQVHHVLGQEQGQGYQQQQQQQQQDYYHGVPWWVYQQQGYHHQVPVTQRGPWTHYLGDYGYGQQQQYQQYQHQYPTGGFWDHVLHGGYYPGGGLRHGYGIRQPIVQDEGVYVDPFYHQQQQQQQQYQYPHQQVVY